MKRASESDTPDDSTVEKKPKSSISSPDQTCALSLERVHLAEDELELSSEGTVEISQEGNSSHEETSMVLDSDYSVFTDTLVVEFMDITKPLTHLRMLLEQKTGKNLSDFKFVLQDSQELDSEKNLVNQCVQGEGLVQINVEIIEKNGLKRLNIADVLKPAEEVSSAANTSNQVYYVGESTYVEEASQAKAKETSKEVITRWIISTDFTKLQERCQIPHDPTNWCEDHVKMWLEWATSTFRVSKVGVRDFKCSGSELMSMSQEEFKARLNCDANPLFWTHLELLRKFKIVVVQQVENNEKFKMRRIPRIGPPKIPYEGSPGNHTGSNGQIQLWQFLLELLTDKDYRDYIQWADHKGEFKLINPEVVAQLWGQRKNKPTMNYEKLSRALRYYYDGEMLAKVHGKRFAYKFVCDLKSLLGYDAYELNRLVKQCEEKGRSAPHSTVLNYQPTESNSTS